MPSYTLRPEQQSAVDQTYQYWQTLKPQNSNFPAPSKTLKPSSSSRQFLWNAKPRFGKTLAAYDFAQKIHAERVLIITNRPAISDSWVSDFQKFIAPETDYIFASAKPPKATKPPKQSKPFKTAKPPKSPTNPDNSRIYSRTELIRRPDLLARPLIFFISLQDIKGKDLASQDFKTKNQWIFDIPKGWDLLIIDEGHEGIKTVKTSAVLGNLKANFTLYLSGTPFRALADQDFSADQIFNWTYLDEQKLYSDRPRLHFQIGALLESHKSLESPESSAQNHLDFLAQIFQSHPEFRHTFWLLSKVSDCKNLQSALSVHPFFRDYQTILAAGKTTSPQASDQPVQNSQNNQTRQSRSEYSGQSILNAVRRAIGPDPLQTKTITLSCGQLTTGITVPEWSAVCLFYSSNDLTRLSSAQYLQAVFRAQNPAQNFPKPEAFVFDFSPDRTLTVLQDYAQNLCSLSPDRALPELLKYLTVESFDVNYNLTPLTASDVVELPRQIIASEIVDGGFISSNKLFNIQNIFHASPDARKIINQLSSLHKNRLEKSPRPLANPTTKLDLSGQPIPNTALINQAFHDVLRSPKYAKISTKNRQQLYSLAVLELTKSNPALNSISNSAITNASNLAPSMPLDQLSPAEHILLENALREIKLATRRLANRRKRQEEDSYRDKLRGFSRTIPMLLHVYGEPDFTLADFSKKIPASAFFALTGITPADFELLRREQYFNELNCNLAIREFMRREATLSTYFLPTSAQDIFDFIPLQYSSHVFTPKPTAQKLLTKLESENPQLFQSPTRTFFDPSTRSGIILAEIIKQLFRNLRPQFTSDHDCLLHILTHQIYAWSPDELSHRAVLNTVLSFVRAHTIDFPVVELDQIHQHFLIFDPLSVQGTINYEKIQAKLKNSWKENMKFDVIISNPPYQLGRRQIYADFYRLAVDLDPELLCMVFPQGWQKPHNHNGLGQLNNPKYKRDLHIVSIDNYDQKSAEQLFPNIGTGGVNIVLRSRSHDNHGILQQLTCGQNPRPIILPIEANEIAKPAELTVLIEQFKYLPKVESLGSARKPYGFYADPLRNPEKYHLTLHETKQNPDDVRLFGLFADGGRGYRYISRASLPKISPNLDYYKIFVPKAWGNMAENIGLGGSYSNICVASPGDACSETFIEFGPFSSQEETIKAAKYFMTKFFRALLFLAKDSQNTAKDKYRYIPLPDFNLGLWQSKIIDLDEQLFNAYDVPSATRNFILQNVQPRSEANIEIL